MTDRGAEKPALSSGWSGAMIAAGFGIARLRGCQLGYHYGGCRTRSRRPSRDPSGTILDGETVRNCGYDERCRVERFRRAGEAGDTGGVIRVGRVGRYEYWPSVDNQHR